MRVSAAHDGPMAVVRLSGRLDGESARHLSDTIEDLLREGARSLEIDMSGVEYLSSAGIRVLAKKAEDLSALRGSLHIVAPSPEASRTLDAAGLSATLVRDNAAPGRASVRSGRFTHWGLPTISAQHGSYEVSRYSDDGVQCRLYGSGSSPLDGPIDPARCRTLPFPARTFGIGVGAIGRTVEETTPRFGELVAAEGIVAYLPTEGTRIPDYMLSYADSAPQAVLGSGLAWDGLFSDLMRFSIQPNSDEVPLAELAEVCVEMSGTEAVAIAIVAEMNALVGASLRRSPALLEAGLTGPEDAAQIREWLSFTPEPAYLGSTALIVGVAARRPSEPLAGHLRPLDQTGALQGHLHAVVFPYLPVPQRTVMLPALIGRLFSESAPRDILHLLYDDRGQDAVGQTGLLRGVCWMSRVTSVEVVS
jgi:anti-anti-sigma factor